MYDAAGAGEVHIFWGRLNPPPLPVKPDIKFFLLIFRRLGCFILTPDSAWPILTRHFESGFTRPEGQLGRIVRISRFSAPAQKRGEGGSIVSRRDPPRRRSLYFLSSGPNTPPPAGRGGLPNRTGAGAGASGTRDLAAPLGQAQRQSRRTSVFPGMGRFTARVPPAARRRAKRAAGDAHPLGQASEVRGSRPGDRHQRHRLPAAHLHPGPVEKAVSPIRAGRPD